MTDYLRSLGWSTVGVLLSAATALAQNAPPTSPTAKVPVREVGPVIARAAQSVTGTNQVRPLSDGSVLVNDVQRRQVLRFDPTLKNVVVIADTAPGALMPYGQRPVSLIPYMGDSTLVADASTLSLVVLDPNGRTVRVMASPRPNDINLLANVNLGTYAFDAQGRLYYRQGGTGGPGGGGNPMAMMFGAGNDGGRNRGGQGGAGNANRSPNQNRGGDMGGPPGGGPPGGFGGGQGGFGAQGGRGANQANQPDSVPIVRVDFDTRTADTITFVRVPKNETQMTRGEDGAMRLTVKINPLPQADDWALLKDGTVAVMRVLDYHVDYYRPDGAHTASEKLPFDWKRISDEDKTKLVDSLKTMANAITQRMGQGGGGFRMSFEPIAPEKLPDYYPPVRPGSSIADHTGNLWVVPTTSNLSAQLAQQFMGGGGPPRGVMAGAGAAPRAPGAPRDSTRQGPPPAAMMAMMAQMANQPPIVYDVIDQAGTLVERVQFPPGRQLVGFGPDGLLYMAARERGALYLETARLK
ncbi:MAG: hypothetical protein ACK6DP_11735 [Gemmatimonas sp.]|uniref:hypothetical protein n=1 Tax=Gemmatimonas sp. TaxID=1962908 RepID=UPI00391F5FAF|nr:hypothetical protein [Gemmatimonadota bacterium]